MLLSGLSLSTLLQPRSKLTGLTLTIKNQVRTVSKITLSDGLNKASFTDFDDVTVNGYADSKTANQAATADSELFSKVIDGDNISYNLNPPIELIDDGSGLSFDFGITNYSTPAGGSTANNTISNIKEE
jgi:hypothetical protein